jgi:hypothetical protein
VKKNGRRLGSALLRSDTHEIASSFFRCLIENFSNPEPQARALCDLYSAVRPECQISSPRNDRGADTDRRPIHGDMQKVAMTGRLTDRQAD